MAGAGRLDVRVEAGAIVEIGGAIKPRAAEAVLDAAGGALLPGLHDHHIHLLSLAKALESIPCGPPNVSNGAQLIAQLEQHAATTGDDDGWLRGIGYHESVAGDIDRAWLDAVMPSRPLRIQHRSGRLWIFNGAALARIGTGTSPLPPGADLASGRFLDADDWLRARLPDERPPLRLASTLLARRGVVGVTDATPSNGLSDHRYFAGQRAGGQLLQDVLVMGSAELHLAARDKDVAVGGVAVGPTKIYLRESALPDFDDLCAAMRLSHAAGRAVAVHCVTVAELVFAASALAEAGHHPGDRIEHASLTPPATLDLLAGSGITVVTQPNFVLERGDQYLADLPAAEQPWLYGGRRFLARSIPLAAGTDAPFGDPDPWRAMAAAVNRRTRGGACLNPDETLAPEEALALFTGPAAQPGAEPRAIRAGAAADLCLLDRPWRDAREDLAAVQVIATLRAGTLIHGPQ